MKRNKVLVFVGLSSAAFFIGRLIYVSNRNKKWEKQIRSQIDTGKAQFGDIRDLDTADALSTTYYEGTKLFANSGAGANPIKERTHKAAKTINDAWGFNDDEPAVYGAFRSLKSKAEISYMAFAYQKMFKIDLLVDMRARLSDSELEKVRNIIASKPVI